MQLEPNPHTPPFEKELTCGVLIGLAALMYFILSLGNPDAWVRRFDPITLIMFAILIGCIASFLYHLFGRLKKKSDH